MHLIATFPFKAFALFLACISQLAISAETAEHVGNTPKTVLLDTLYNHELKNNQPYHYTWDDTAPSGFSKLGAVFTEHGARLEHLATAPTQESLRNASIYIIVDPDTESEAANQKPNFMDASAAEVIVRWVESGGTLMLMNNNRGNADFEHTNILTKRFGITLNEDSRNETPKGDRKRATVTIPSTDHPLFHDIPAIYMKEVCTLSVQAPAHAILTAPKETGPGTDVLMATCALGKGRVLVVGDPWLYNEYIDFVPPGSAVKNRKTAVNLVCWLLGPGTEGTTR